MDLCLDNRGRCRQAEVRNCDLAPRCSEFRCVEVFHWPTSQSCSESSSAISGGAAGQSVLIQVASKDNRSFANGFHKFWAVDRTHLSRVRSARTAETGSVLSPSHRPDKSPRNNQLESNHTHSSPQHMILLLPLIPTPVSIQHSTATSPRYILYNPYHEMESSVLFCCEASLIDSS